MYKCLHKILQNICLLTIFEPFFVYDMYGTSIYIRLCDNNLRFSDNVLLWNVLRLLFYFNKLLNIENRNCIFLSI